MVFLWFSLNPFSSNAPFDHRLPQILRQGLEQFGLYLPPEDRAHEKARSMKSHVMYWEFCKAMDRYLMICMYLFIKLCMYLSMYVIIHIIYRRYKYIYIHTYIHHHTAYIHTTLVCLKTRDTPRLTISSWRKILTMEPKSSRCLDQFRPPVSRFVSQSPCFLACTLLIILCWKWKTHVLLRFETTGIWTPLKK
jgi:hypothetical protein